MAVPGYCQDDPALARVIDEAHADLFLRQLSERTVREALPRERRELPVADLNATVLRAGRADGPHAQPAGRRRGRRPVARRGHAAGAARPGGGGVTVTAWLAVVIFLCAYALIATEKIHRVAAALGAAGLMLLIHATDAEGRLLLRALRRRLERHLPAARHDDHCRRAQADRRLRVPGHLGGQTGQRAVPSG
ncbi:hypothetical protein [Nonomuraea dietziae]|uniref:hypothetical protein n=1 Tax=Nonomuraea dietziae TaxID=65515 RepID=UPI0031D9C59C